MTEDSVTASSPRGGSFVAPVWHTVLLVTIFLGITIAGALFQRHAQSSPGSLQQHPMSLRSIYL
jgi:hypothetical protein